MLAAILNSVAILVLGAFTPKPAGWIAILFAVLALLAATTGLLGYQR